MSDQRGTSVTVKRESNEKIKKNRKHRIGIGIYLLSVIALFVLAVGIKNFNTANAAFEGVNPAITIPTDTSKSLGTAERPFVVLEVVPYEGFASFGYLVAGEEPVNLKVCSYSTKAANILATHDGLDVIDKGEKKTFFPSAELLKAMNVSGSGITKQDNVVQYGYYKEVEVASSGAFDLDNIQYEDNGLGGVRIATAGFIEVTTGGAFNWVGSEADVTANPEATDYNKEKIYTTRLATLYTYHEYDIKNRNLFKRCIPGLTNEDDIKNYVVKVITVTAQQLNGDLGLINRANLIYITDRCMDNNFAELWNDNTFLRSDLFVGLTLEPLADYNTLRFTKLNYDLSWPAVRAIFEKQTGSEITAGVKNCPVIFDAHCFSDQPNAAKTSVTVIKKAQDNQEVVNKTETGYKNNVYKLGLLLRQMDSYQIYQTLFQSNTIIEVSNTGSFESSLLNNDAKLYWNDYTLIPDQVPKTSSTKDKDFADMRIRYKDFGKNEFAHDNTYIYNYSEGMSKKFSSGTTPREIYTEGVYEYDNSYVGNLTPAQVMKYLLDCSNDGENLEKVSILDVEPGIMYYKNTAEVTALFKTDEYWNRFIHYMMPGFNGSVTVDKQTLKEFNCKIDDLNATYNLVYIGMNTTVSGLAYTNVGEKKQLDLDDWSGYNKNVANMIPGGNANSGVFYTRFSGNDITSIKSKELMDYTKAGYPVILGTGVLKSDGSVDLDKTDRASFMYNLFNQLTTNTDYKDSTMLENKEIGHKLSLKLNKNVCILRGISLPIPYRDRKTEEENTPPGTPLDTSPIYINETDPANKKLKYKVKIDQGEGINGRYKLMLCIDMNADGKYSKAYEKVDSMDIYRGGTKISNDSYLKAGEEYDVVVDVETYVGVLTWQLLVDQYDGSDNLTGVSDSIYGVSAIKCNTVPEKVNLKILQIIKNDKNDTTIALPTDGEIGSAKSVYEAIPNYTRDNVIKSFKNKVIIDGSSIDDNRELVSGLFHYYTKDLNDYNLSFERLTIDDVNDKIIDFYTTHVSTPNVNTNYLKEFDMLIIGFADASWPINSDTTLNAIDEYVTSGRTLLLTHDTSFYQTTHKFTMKFRERLGMDRYGVLMMNSGADYGFAARDAAKKNIIYTPQQSLTPTPVRTDAQDKLSYGFTDQMIMRNLSSYKSLNWVPYMTKKVNQTNTGQITSYPYKIKPNITVAKTHSQYFQLDLEDKDIVVWYTLSQDDVLKNSSGNNLPKALEYNDGRNGYYIYNKGNITYSGAGHSSAGDNIKDWEKKQNETQSVSTDMVDEVKLFINTIIAAHRATPEVSTLDVKNSDLTSYNKKDYVYVQYDSNENTPTAVGQDIVVAGCKRVYFQLDNSSIMQNPSNNVTYNLVTVDNAGNETKTLCNMQTYQKSDNPPYTWTPVSSANLTASPTYYIDVPIDLLDDRDVFYLDFDIILTYGVGETHTLVGTRRLAIARRGLFNMD